MAGWLDGPRASAALRRAQRALANGDAGAALAQSSRARELRPRWLPVLLWHAAALGAAGRDDEATTVLEDARDLQPDSPVVYLWLGRLLIDRQRHDEARAVLETGNRLGSTNLHIPSYLALAAWAAETGDDSDAEPRAFDELTRLWPHGGDALAGRFLLLLEERFPGGPGTDFPAPAEPSGGVLERFESFRSRRLIERARRLHGAKKHARAAELVERAALLTPLDDDALELGVLARRDAVSLRMEQLEGDPYDVDLRLVAVEDLLEIGLPTRALEVLAPAAEAIEKLDPHRLTWRAEHALLRGRTLLDLAEPEAAAEHLEQARELWPLEVEPVYYLGVARLRAGRRGAARRCFISACELDHALLEMRTREYRAAT